MKKSKKLRPIRIRCGVLILASVLGGGFSAAVGAETLGVNLVSDSAFSLGQWRVQPSTFIQSFNIEDGTTKNAACVQLTSARKGNNGRDSSKPENLIYLPGIETLQANSRYRLTYKVRALTNVPSGARKGVLMASVTATETNDSKGYVAAVYAEHQKRIAGGSFVTHTLDFSTPLKQQSRKTEIMFQALSDNDNYQPAQHCVTDVQLIPLGRDLENASSSTTTAAIRYNQLVAAPEDGTNAYFSIVNPGPFGVVEVVTGSGASEKVVSSQSLGALVKTELHSGLQVAGYATSWSGPAKLRLRSFGRIAAETPTLNFVSSNPYKTAAPQLRRDALHFFYAQRAGQDIIDRRYQETAYRNWLDRPAGHRNETATCFSGVDNFGNDFAGACGNMAARDVSGGWYDAGDHGKYVVNGATALWALQNVIEDRQRKGTLNQDFPDGMLKYGTNGRSDLLDEARYEMEWLLKMQIQDTLMVRVPAGENYDQDFGLTTKGVMLDTPAKVYAEVGSRTFAPTRGIVKLPLTAINARGMVFSAVRDAAWTSIPISPADDKEARVLDYPTTIATLNFAAVAAQSYRIWKDIDAEFAAKCLSASKVAWDAASRNPKVFRYGEYSDGLSTALRAINQGGGAYADTSPDDAIAWAAMEIYLATSVVGGSDSTEAKAYLKAQSDLSIAGEDAFTFSVYNYAESFSWKHNKNMGLMSLLVNGRDVDIVAKAKAATGLDVSPPSKSLVTLVAQRGQNVGKSPFGVPHVTGSTEPFNWASNADIANSGGIFAYSAMYASSSTDRAKALGYARRTMSYLLGNNPLGKSYVTGYGQNPVRNPHHRFWAKQADIAYPSAPPGMLVGGPNGKWDGTALSATQNTSGSWGWWGDTGADFYMREIVPVCNNEPIGVRTAAGKKGGILCYQDRYDLYMTNEVAINWNSALFWLSAYLD